MKVTLAVWAVAVASVTAHMHNAGVHNNILRRAKPTGEAAYASMSSPDEQCKYYEAKEISQMMKNNLLPKPGHIANLIDSDSEAQQIWKDIQNSGIIPDGVYPKADSTNGEHEGTDSDASNYNVDKDPDCWWTASGCVKPKHDNIPEDYDTCPEANTYGLTFDDGPNCSHNAFYDYLAQKKLKATMFFIGTNVAQLPYQAQRALADGHDICGHTWAHRYMTTLSNEQVFAELFYTARVIKAVLGVTTTCWRPPFGDVDDRVRAIAAGLGLRTVLWKQDSDDWNIKPYGTASPSKIQDNYQKIIDKAGSMSPIVLSHELYNETMGMFMKMQPAISKAYANVVPVSACQNITQPYIEDSITYPTFSEFITGQQPKGLPDGNSMKIDPNVKYTVTPLSKQKVGFSNPSADKPPASASSSSASGASSSAASSGANSQAGGAGAAAATSDASTQAASANANASGANKEANNAAATTALSVVAPFVVGLTLLSFAM